MGTHVLERILEVDVLRYGNAVVGDRRGSPLLIKGDVSSARFNADGVDLNRNFDCDWAPTGTWQNKTVSGGTAAFSEPEAAAIAGLRAKATNGQISAQDCVIVCDAGGGTVDVVTYQVQSDEPLILSQCVAADGDLCGSVFVDLEFQNQLQSFLQDDVDRLADTAVEDIMETFEYKIKPSYDPLEQRPRPCYLHVPGVDDDANRKIKNNTLELDM